MRINEFVSKDPTNTLATALELVRYRYKDKKLTPKIKTDSLINLIRNTDRTFDYDALVAANEENPAVKNIIKSFNKDEVILNPFGDETDAEEVKSQTVDNDQAKAPVDTVSKMAKRAGKKRDADIF